MPSTKKRRLAAEHTTRPDRIVALVFGGAVIAFSLLVGYFAFSKTTITIVVAPEEVDVAFPLHLTEEPSAEEIGVLTFPGIVQQERATVEKRISSFTTTIGRQGRASGTVTVHNTWSQPQPLAATTRFLSESGVLFRTAERVDVPAGGTVTATITADETGSIGNVAAGRFTIPGLSRDLQERVYATSDKPMTGGLLTVSTLAENDLKAAYDSAEAEARAKLVELLTGKNSSGAFTISPEAVTITDRMQSASAAVGDEVNEFTVTVTLTGIAIGLDDAQIEATATELLTEKLEDGEALMSGSPTLSYKVSASDLNAQTATIDVAASHKKILTPEHSSLNEELLTGKTREELQTFLKSLPNVQEVMIDLSPPWSRRTPRLVSHIEVRVEVRE